MSTFTQWNGPGMQGVPVAQWTQLINAYEELSKTLHEHITKQVGEKFTYNNTTKKYDIEAGYVHGFDQPLKDLADKLATEVSTLKTELAQKQGLLTPCTYGVSDSTVKQYVTPNKLENRITDHTHILECEDTIGEDSKTSTKPPTTKAVYDAISSASTAALASSLKVTSITASTDAGGIPTVGAVNTQLATKANVSLVGTLPSGVSTITGYIDNVKATIVAANNLFEGRDSTGKQRMKSSTGKSLEKLIQEANANISRLQSQIAAIASTDATSGVTTLKNGAALPKLSVSGDTVKTDSFQTNSLVVNNNFKSKYIQTDFLGIANDANDLYRFVLTKEGQVIGECYYVAAPSMQDGDFTVTVPNKNVYANPFEVSLKLTTANGKKTFTVNSVTQNSKPVTEYDFYYQAIGNPESNHITIVNDVTARRDFSVEGNAKFLHRPYVGAVNKGTNEVVIKNDLEDYVTKQSFNDIPIPIGTIIYWNELDVKTASYESTLTAEEKEQPENDLARKFLTEIPVTSYATRSDLLNADSSRWLPCDGRTIKVMNYPELGAVLLGKQLLSLSISDKESSVSLPKIDGAFIRAKSVLETAVDYTDVYDSKHLYELIQEEIAARQAADENFRVSQEEKDRTQDESIASAQQNIDSLKKNVISNTAVILNYALSEHLYLYRDDLPTESVRGDAYRDAQGRKVVDGQIVLKEENDILTFHSASITKKIVSDGAGSSVNEFSIVWNDERIYNDVLPTRSPDEKGNVIKTKDTVFLLKDGLLTRYVAFAFGDGLVNWYEVNE